MAYNELEQRGTSDFPVEFFHVDVNHPRYYMSAHWHSEIEIIRIIEGELEIKLDNNCYNAKKGDVIFVNSETIHYGIPNNCVYECIVFHIDFLYMDTYSCKFFIESILNRDYTIIEYNPYKNSEFHNTTNEIFEALKHKSPGYKFRAIAAFYKFLGVIVDNHMYIHTSTNSVIPHEKSMLKLKKILSFIRTNYDKQITLEDMAKTAEMSPKYFGVFFKNMTSKTPIDYLNEYRIEKASQKLANSDLSVTDIAYTCGFNDLSYFIKIFKKIKHQPPGKFRKENL